MGDQTQAKNPAIIPVILCGGSGTRLWPASRESHPKQFLSLVGEDSLLQNTAQRALALSGAPASSLVVVTLAAMKDMIESQLSKLSPSMTQHILCEPSARNTAAAVAAAAVYVRHHFGDDAILWILPSDHHIGDEAKLKDALSLALPAAQDGKLVTFGIKPSRPDTGYGYIRAGQTSSHANVLDVEKFVEKPDLKTAQDYVASGQYLWNSGMFLFTALAAINEFTTHAPNILAGVQNAINIDEKTLSNEIYATIESQPFDKAIMEKSSHVCVVPANPDWSDIGSWESLWDICPKDDNNNVLDGHAVTLNTKNSLIHSKEKLIAIAGLDNIVVVETDDAILIMNKQDNDSMRALIKKLKDSGAREVA